MHRIALLPFFHIRDLADFESKNCLEISKIEIFLKHFGKTQKFAPCGRNYFLNFKFLKHFGKNQKFAPCGRKILIFCRNVLKINKHFFSTGSKTSSFRTSWTSWQIVSSSSTLFVSILKFGILQNKISKNG